MSWQTDVEAISATVTATSGYSVEALDDANGGTSVSAPSSTVVNLDSKLIKLILAGTIPTSPDVTVSMNGTNFVTIHNTNGSIVLPFLLEITGVWSSAKSKFVFYIGDQNGGPVGYGITPVDGVLTSVTSQTNLTFSVNNAASVTQFTMKLA